MKYNKCREDAHKVINDPSYLSNENLEDEIWLDTTVSIDYQISNKGRVRSKSRLTYNGKGYFTSKEKIMRPNVLAKGYLQVSLTIDGKRKLMQVHRLVALAFIPNPNNYPQVNHINCIKCDNCVENLEWCNNSQNQKHAYKTGLQVVTWKAGKPKKRIVQFTKDGTFVREWDSIAECVRHFGCKKSVSLINVLKHKKHFNSFHGYKFEYLEQ